MKKNIYLLIIYFISMNAWSDGYNIDVLPQEPITIPDNIVIDFSNRRSREQPVSKMPLFTQTCDNIAYSGVIEQQVISLLTDVKDFVTAVTDPVVTVNKFDAGIFLYAFGKCFSASTKEVFGSCSDQRTGESCISDTITEVFGNTDKVATVAAGMEGSLQSTGITTKSEFSLSKLFTAGSNIIPTMIDNGWFDITFECINEERQKVLKFLDGIFKRNYKIKTSIISSINKKCEVSVREDGDPTTWGDIYNLNKEQMGGETSDFMKAVEDYVSGSITEIPEGQVNSAALKREIDKMNCYDGVGPANCKSVSEKENIKDLSKYSIDSSNNKDYQGEKAIAITAHFFDKNADIIDTYTNEVANTINPIKGVLDALVPQDGNPINPGIFTEIPVEKFIVEFNNLKDRLNIQPGSLLYREINNIFYRMSQPMYFLKLKRTNGQKFKLPNGDEVELLPLPNPIAEPSVDPFNKDFIRYLGTGGKDNLNVIAKTYTGKYIMLDTGLSEVKHKSILGFYRSLVSALIVATSEDEVDLWTGLSIYDKERLVSDDTYKAIKNSLDTAIDVHSQFNYKHILNDEYELSKQAGYSNAALEYHMIKFLLVKRILKLLFTIEGDPTTDSDNIEVESIERYHQLPNDMFYGLISMEKGYSLPRRNLNKDVYYLVSRFYKILSSRYMAGDMINLINIKTKQIEEYNKFNKLEIRVNTLLNLVRTTTKENDIESLQVIEDIR